MRRHDIKKKGDLIEVTRTETVFMDRATAEAHLRHLEIQIEDCDRSIDRLKDARGALEDERNQLRAQLKDWLPTG
ncbi:MAG TPA: hypothetical protein VNT01_01175 [Symbiobacteriaceae bacterium]|nr:hypothetical protein [Symbiobacteriaceae bacterium]